jgi:hypothetical protein
VEMKIIYGAIGGKEMRIVKGEHTKCLRTASIVLNLYQNIEDILSYPSLTDKDKVKRIKKENRLIGKAVAKYLPK